MVMMQYKGDSKLYINKIWNSVVSNPLDTRLFLLVKVCARARSKFEIVIFCALVLTRGSNQNEITYLEIFPKHLYICKIQISKKST